MGRAVENGAAGEGERWCRWRVRGRGCWSSTSISSSTTLFKDSPRSIAAILCCMTGPTPRPLFFTDWVWPFRAEAFYRAGITPPRCEDLDGFWDRFTFTEPEPPLFYADSNLFAGRVTPAHYALFDGAATTWREVHLFDAHHDSGYPHEDGPATFEQWRTMGQYSCEDWMLIHHAAGSRLTLTYPAWRPQGDAHPPMVPLSVNVDDRTPVASAFDAVFLCRSGAWVPSWCDDQFSQLLQAFPGRTHPFPGARWAHPRPDPLPQAPPPGSGHGQAHRRPHPRH